MYFKRNVFQRPEFFFGRPVATKLSKAPPGRGDQADERFAKGCGTGGGGANRVTLAEVRYLDPTASQNEFGPAASGGALVVKFYRPDEP